MNAAIGKLLTQFDANGRAKSPPPRRRKIQDVLTRPRRSGASLSAAAASGQSQPQPQSPPPAPEGRSPAGQSSR